MQLYLVQHGASKSETEDPQRGLTEEGRRVVEHLAHHLAAVGVAVERIEHSEKLRARQTAEILAAALHPREGTKQVSGIGPTRTSDRCARLTDGEKNGWPHERCGIRVPGLFSLVRHEFGAE